MWKIPYTNKNSLPRLIFFDVPNRKRRIFQSKNVYNKEIEIKKIDPSLFNFFWLYINKTWQTFICQLETLNK